MTAGDFLRLSIKSGDIAYILLWFNAVLGIILTARVLTRIR
ncbi:hypothetical protein J2S10_003164 [Neobacillus ginsengisoli]|uniref:Uncharacterized protein n=1 Tax=Neobacillus ginsengisoli TaxID=904295 RepID=A0ABT9XXA5_9BACI|nr:hypothetical protein [Neobacillus ginsengisoli]